MTSAALRLVTPVALGAAALGAGASPQFKASVDVVRVEALVTERGRPVTGLTAADFTVTDNGARQELTVRPLTSVDLDVVVALDVSGSVQGDRLDRLRKATRALVGALTPRDRTTLVAFNHLVTLGPADAAPDVLARRVERLAAAGATSLVDGTVLAMTWASGRDRPVLVLVCSDGRDTTSWTRVDQALALARRSNGVVDVVLAGAMPSTVAARGRSASIRSGRPALESPSQALFEPVDEPSQRFLVELTGLTGGRMLDGHSSGLAATFATSLAQFRTRYEITYTPTAPAPGWHDVSVDVKGRRGATVHARRGYQR